jgi:hypothetical protein
MIKDLENIEKVEIMMQLSCRHNIAFIMSPQLSGQDI